jgi:hypothetical protein
MLYVGDYGSGDRLAEYSNPEIRREHTPEGFLVVRPAGSPFTRARVNPQPGLVVLDFAVRLVATLRTPGNVAISVNEGSDVLHVSVSGEGRMLSAWRNSNSAPIVPPFSDPNVVRPIGSPNEVTYRAKGTDVEVYLNDTLAFRFQRGDASHGIVGFSVGGPARARTLEAVIHRSEVSE